MSLGMIAVAGGIESLKGGDTDLSLNQQNKSKDTQIRLKSIDELVVDETQSAGSRNKLSKGKSKPLNQWDKNGNGLLEPSEKEAMYQDFYSRYDVNGDGIIDEDEKVLIMKDLNRLESINDQESRPVN